MLLPKTTSVSFSLEVIAVLRAIDDKRVLVHQIIFERCQAVEIQSLA